eukprot:CAMPEP_0170519606 /NCGR_PEP_ID=MMETSP0209-20121228/4966_1 /TAXON_ID=665100 ORGANISM="Litonotus pictus, Strain P1" /NCGR_SAMPLE_ID=MMETSP0209 /ASSEMBLY_ACC=CAM_ASM_000301 /LENGTH=226 /DNA_ID=CAMNT_0010805543 /DNA_START=1 /DNA_END=681 /DNA_ORIENTATION=+
MKSIYSLTILLLLYSCMVLSALPIPSTYNRLITYIGYTSEIPGTRKAYHEFHIRWTSKTLEGPRADDDNTFNSGNWKYSEARAHTTGGLIPADNTGVSTKDDTDSYKRFSIFLPNFSGFFTNRVYVAWMESGLPECSDDDEAHTFIDLKVKVEIFSCLDTAQAFYDEITDANTLKALMGKEGDGVIAQKNGSNLADNAVANAQDNFSDFLVGKATTLILCVLTVPA